MSYVNTLTVSADLHIDAGRWGRSNPQTGVSSAWESASQVWNFICSETIDRGAEALLFAGDAFLNATPTPEAQEMFADGLRILSKEGIKVIMIPGNHEYLGLPGSYRHPLWRYADIDGVTVSHKPEVIRLDSGIQIATLPWPRKSLFIAEEDLAGVSPDEIDDLISVRIADQLDLLAEDIDANDPSVLLAHATVGEARLGTDRRGSEITVASLFSEPILPVDVLSEGPWGHVALGHIHKRQTIANTAAGGAISYVGSPERIDWSEEREDKGYSVLTIDTTISERFEATPARKLVTITANGEPSIDQDLSDTLIRLKLADSDTDQRAWRREVANSGGTIVTTVTPPPVQRITQGTIIASEDLSPLDALERWIDAQDIDESLRESVRAVAQELSEGAQP